MTLVSCGMQMRWISCSKSTCLPVYLSVMSGCCKNHILSGLAKMPNFTTVAPPGGPDKPRSPMASAASLTTYPMVLWLYTGQLGLHDQMVHDGLFVDLLNLPQVKMTTNYIEESGQKEKSTKSSPYIWNWERDSTSGILC